MQFDFHVCGRVPVRTHALNGKACVNEHMKGLDIEKKAKIWMKLVELSAKQLNQYAMKWPSYNRLCFNSFVKNRKKDKTKV